MYVPITVGPYGLDIYVHLSTRREILEAQEKSTTATQLTLNNTLNLFPVVI